MIKLPSLNVTQLSNLKFYSQKNVQSESHPEGPSEFFAGNSARTAAVAAQLKLQSLAAETSAMAIVDKFLSSINEPGLDGTQLAWLDPEKLAKQVATATDFAASDPGTTLLSFFFFEAYGS